MAQVTLRISGHAYTIACQDGEEQHLAAMGAEVEKRIETAKSLGAHSGEARLLVMAALMMADELHDLHEDAESAKKKPATAASAERPRSERLGRIAARAEQIATSVERH